MPWFILVASVVEKKMMTRPLVAITLSYIFGIITAALLLEDPLGVYLLLSVFMVVGVGAYLWRTISVPIFMMPLILVVFLIGAVAFWLAAAPPDGGLAAYRGLPITVEGIIVEEPCREEGYTTYRFRPQTLVTGEGEQRAEGGYLLVRIYDGKDGTVYRYGERLRLEGEIVEPKGKRNPGGFDYRFYLRAQGVDLLMYLQPHQVTFLGEGAPNRLAGAAFTLRSRMIEGLENSLPSPQAELLEAILFGRRESLPADVEENFRRSGTNHLMAVSGLHVGLVAALILGFWRLIKLKPGGPLAIILSILLIFAYAYLTGMRPAALRAAVMLSMGFVALLLGREKDFPSAIALAALITLVYNPLLLFTVGFQLSYVATLSLYYLYPILYREIFFRIPFGIGQLMAVTLAAQIGVLFLGAYYFGQLPLAALFFNILMLPVMALVVGLGLVGGLTFLFWPLLSSVLLSANLPLLTYILRISYLAEAPWVNLEATPGFSFLLVYYLGLFLLVKAYDHHLRLIEPTAEAAGDRKMENTLNMAVIGRYLSGFASRCKKLVSRRETGRIVVIILLGVTLVVWAGIFINPSMSGLTVYFVDVGQGAAVFLETSRGFTMLIDGGGEPVYTDPSRKGQIGEKILLPFLRHRGVKKIDLLVITHPHEDHFGGLFAVIDNLSLGHVLVSSVPGESAYYEQFLELVREKGLEPQEIHAGSSWEPCRNLFMEVVSPPQQPFSGTGCDLNNNSIVLRVTYGEVSFLFTGDIEEEAVAGLLASGMDISARVLQYPHHGGNLAPAVPFLKKISPQVAVIQVGRNTFGHPHPATIEVLRELGVTTYRNDIHGAVILRTDGRSLWQKTMLEAG